MYEEKLIKLIQIPSVSIEGEKIEFKEIEEYIKDNFPNFYNACEFKNIDGPLLFILRGKKTNNKPYLFMNHHDVVQVEGEWKYPGFGGEIHDNKIYGRGTLDTKGGLFCMLQAAEELISEGFIPNRDLYFVSNNDEETNTKGGPKVVKYLEENNITFDLILDEGGMITYDPIGGAKGFFAMVGVGEKPCLDILVSAKSHGGHASSPAKNTPIVRLARFVKDIEDKNIFKSKLSDTTSEMFRKMSLKMSGIKKFVFKNNKLFKPLLEKVAPNLSPAANAIFKTTCAFTKAQGSEQFNSIPETAYININMRSSLHEGYEHSVAQVKKIADKYDLGIETRYYGGIPKVSDYRTKQFKLIENTISNIFKDVVTAPYITNTGADIRFFKNLSDNCFGFVPFIVTAEQIASIHGTNENVDISCLEPAVKFYKELMKETYYE